jgi:hypothetical protein
MAQISQSDFYGGYHLVDLQRGILTIAHTQPRYAKEAVALARSIRLRDPHVPLAVATNLSADLFNGMFDIVIPSDFTQWSGMLSKLMAYDLSPFDQTLLVDTDCFALESVSRAFDALSGAELGVFGANKVETNWQLYTLDVVRRLWPSDTYPIFNGGIYYFRKLHVAAEVFRLAKEMSTQYDELRMRRLNGLMGEEPLMSVAMARMGLFASDDEVDVVIGIAPFSRLGIGGDIDVLSGRGSVQWNGRRVRPVFMHFSGIKSTWLPYCREAARLDAYYRAPRPSALMQQWIVARAMFDWVRPRIHRAVRRRIRWIDRPG